MSRPKVTYREGKALSLHPSLTASARLDAGEEKLPRALQVLLFDARLQTVDQAARPSGQEIRTTLEHLANKASVEERLAVRSILDGYTQAALATAALKLEGPDDIDPVGWNPVRLREMAKEALARRTWSSMFRAGKPRSARIDEWLADRLRGLWAAAGMPARPGASPPRRIADLELHRWIEAERFASLSAFAQATFKRLGRPLKASSIRDLLTREPSSQG